MNHKQRRELENRERIELDGKTDFPESLLSPRNKYNKIPLFVVKWTDKRGKRTGNSYQNKERAVEVRDRKINDGTFLATMTAYCAGFAF